MTEVPETERDARLAIRALERGVDRIRTAPVAEVGFGPRYYLHRAQAALRQAERAFAKVDDVTPPLKPLAPQVRRRQRPAERRKRYRCTGCFTEILHRDADVERHPYHTRLRKDADGNREWYECGEWQIVPPLRRRKARM